MAEDRAAEVAAAWTLRADGASQRTIAAELGCSLGKANALVREAAEAETVIGSDDRSTARIREATHLDMLWTAAETRLADDPLSAVPVMLKVSAARRALLGLDAATKVQITDERKAPRPDPEIRAAVERAQSEAARRRAEIRGQGTAEGDETGDETEGYGAA